MSWGRWPGQVESTGLSTHSVQESGWGLMCCAGSGGDTDIPVPTLANMGRAQTHGALHPREGMQERSEGSDRCEDTWVLTAGA